MTCNFSKQCYKILLWREGCLLSSWKLSAAAPDLCSPQGLQQDFVAQWLCKALPLDASAPNFRMVERPVTCPFSFLCSLTIGRKFNRVIVRWIFSQIVKQSSSFNFSQLEHAGTALNLDWETQVLGDGTGCGKGRPGCECNMIAAVCKAITQFNVSDFEWLGYLHHETCVRFVLATQLFCSLGWDELGNVLGMYFRLLQGNLCFAIPHVELWPQTSRCLGFRMYWNLWIYAVKSALEVFGSVLVILTFQGPFGSQRQAWTPSLEFATFLVDCGKCELKGCRAYTARCISLSRYQIVTQSTFVTFFVQISSIHVFSDLLRFQVICTTMHVGWPQRISGWQGRVPIRMARVFGFELTLR